MTNRNGQNTGTECPSCGQSDVHRRGRLPDADFFAGRDVDPPLPGGSLYACNACGLHFRWPRMSKQQVDALYCQADESHWNSPADRRPDWQLARQWIADLSPGRSVLDIACFDGRFLGLLDDHHHKYGIEIQPGAAAIAQRRGVTIVTHDFARLGDVDRKFDVITAFDLIEHVHQPIEFLASVADGLQPGGVVILGTGNTDAPSWRFMGAHYWYCSNMEHISFINPRWCRNAAARLNLSVERISRLSHCYPTITKICREVTINVLHRAAPRYSASLRYRYRALFRPRRRNSRYMQPAWFSAKDHLLVALRKPGLPRSAPCETPQGCC